MRQDPRIVARRGEPHAQGICDAHGARKGRCVVRGAWCVVCIARRTVEPRRARRALPLRLDLARVEGGRKVVDGADPRTLCKHTARMSRKCEASVGGVRLDEKAPSEDSTTPFCPLASGALDA